ncbi:hypothetical protein ALC56_15286 [Trachymyrmex septentrionalis]|uniref:HAT C-terminal dimerisation domain-containing protein n=1 Tax=Trachymyrmex septentrionalis TaxID=34720 RepID=A0A195EQN5_9HYME|nr:hypothetical protein ALC56_15286 [Trachymyrmex septentrionalis]
MIFSLEIFLNLAIVLQILLIALISVATAETFFSKLKIIKKTRNDEAPKEIKKDMQHCFQKWEKRWIKCILSKGKYFQG